MSVPVIDLHVLAQINRSAAFNAWAGFEVADAEPGRSAETEASAVLVATGETIFVPAGGER